MGAVVHRMDERPASEIPGWLPTGSRGYDIGWASLACDTMRILESESIAVRMFVAAGRLGNLAHDVGRKHSGGVALNIRHFALFGFLLLCCNACGRPGAHRPVAASLAEVKPDDLLTVDEASKLLGQPLVFQELQSIFPRSRIFKYTTADASYTSPVIQLTICPVGSKTAFEYFTHIRSRSEKAPCKLGAVGEVCLAEGATTVHVLSRNTYIQVQLWRGRDNPVPGPPGGAEELAQRIVHLLPEGEPETDRSPGS